MRMFCLICGKEIPEEDKDIVSTPNTPIVCQIQCRSCNKVFTVCEEKRFMKVVFDGPPKHPEN